MNIYRATFREFNNFNIYNLVFILSVFVFLSTGEAFATNEKTEQIEIPEHYQKVITRDFTWGEPDPTVDPRYNADRAATHEWSLDEAQSDKVPHLGFRMNYQGCSPYHYTPIYRCRAPRLEIFSTENVPPGEYKLVYKGLQYIRKDQEVISELHLTFLLKVGGSAPDRRVIGIQPARLPNGNINIAYAEQSLSLTGATSPAVFSVRGLPPGLRLSGNKIMGTPTKAGNYDVIVTGKDAKGHEITHSYAVVISNSRPDPSKDEEVIGLVRAQVNATNQLAKMQIGNFTQRLEQLHREESCGSSLAGIRIGVQDRYLQSGLDRMRQQFGAHEACAEQKSNFSSWVNGEVNLGKFAGNAENIQKHIMIGVSGGIDYRFSPEFTAGIGYGYGRIVSDIGKNGTINNGKMLSTAVYSSFQPVKNIFLDSMLGYGWLQFDSQRYVSASNKHASGLRYGHQILGAVTLSYAKHRADLLLSPYIRMNVAQTKLNGFTETGADIYDLKFGSQNINLFATTLGIRSEYPIHMRWGELIPHSRFEYTHDFAGSSLASIDYMDKDDAPPYSIDMGRQIHDNFKVEFGLDAHIKRAWLLGANYSTEIASTNHALQHNFSVKLSTAF